MAQMRERVSTHQALSGLDCNSEKQSDEGLMTNLTCEISCSGSAIKRYTLNESFLPESLGLQPGNGSNGTDTTLWGSLTVTLKSWSQEKCLEKAHEVCGDYSKISESNLENLASGEWKIKRFPGCHEKEATISPFDDSVKSNRVGGMMKKVAEFALPKMGEFDSFSPKATYQHIDLIRSSRKLDYKSEKCAKPILGDVCFGDCIDMSKSYTVETLGTPEPLGRDKLEVCGDKLSEFMKDQKLSPSVKKTLCEDFFWNSIKIRDGVISTCAAMRGEVDCSKL